MDIGQEQLGEVYVLAPVGRLDSDTESDLDLAIQDLDSVGARHFLIDLSQIGYVSSAGLRVLLALAKSCEGDGSLRLAGMSPQVKQVFDVAGFTRLFQIYPDRKAALDKHPHAGPPVSAAAPAAPAPAPKPAATDAPAPAPVPAPAPPVVEKGPSVGKLAASLLGASESGAAAGAESPVGEAAAKLFGIPGADAADPAKKRR